MSKSSFYNEINKATIETGVGDVYKKGLGLYFPNEVLLYPYDCDGYLETIVDGTALKLIVEFKYDQNLQNNVSRAKILAQVIYYLKKFEINGKVLPNVLLVGDRNEAFIMHTNPLLDYLDENVDWQIAPSDAASKNVELVSKISLDDNINPFVWVVNEKFSFKDVADKIKDVAKNIKRSVRITEHNIATIFEYFTTRVIKRPDELSANDLVGIFISVFVDRNNCYKHPNNQNILVCNNNTYQINGKAFDSFFSHFEKEYTPQEKNKFTAISDRLIEDTKRRKKGEFFTPTQFTDYAHKMLCDEFGDAWRDEYIVWDCCWGTGNLTRDYHFKELYASTLEQAELDCGKRYNIGSPKFIFDFLNDSIADFTLPKIPETLFEALNNNKPIIFFINPPYATPSSNMGKGKTQGKGKEACRTYIYDQMVANNMREASKNLFAQFLYRIFLIKNEYNLTNVNIALFCKPIYLSGSSFEQFRTLFLNEFEFRKSILFNASCFADVSDKWGIHFSIWRNGVTENKSEFIHDVVNDVDGEIIIRGTKTIYNTDELVTGKHWIKEPLKHIKTLKIKKPPLSSAIKMTIGTNSNTSIYENALGCYHNVGNDVYNSSQKVTIYTSCDSSNANGLSIVPENYERIITMFSARKLVKADWINDKDNFLQPNTSHSLWTEFVSDSIIFSLFHSSSQQSSLRNLLFREHTWNIENEFFFLSKDRIMELANNYHYDYTYNDANASNDRYVYKLLQNTVLSEDAQVVLDKAQSLIERSFKYRELFHQEYPDYQIMNWDCGWAQIKAVLKEYFITDLNDFTKLYIALSEKMRPLIYELGFLK